MGQLSVAAVSVRWTAKASDNSKKMGVAAVQNGDSINCVFMWRKCQARQESVCMYFFLFLFCFCFCQLVCFVCANKSHFVLRKINSDLWILILPADLKEEILTDVMF